MVDHPNVPKISDIQHSQVPNRGDCVIYQLYQAGIESNSDSLDSNHRFVLQVLPYINRAPFQLPIDGAMFTD